MPDMFGAVHQLSDQLGGQSPEQDDEEASGVEMACSSPIEIASPDSAPPLASPRSVSVSARRRDVACEDSEDVAMGGSTSDGGLVRSGESDDGLGEFAGQAPRCVVNAFPSIRSRGELGEQARVLISNAHAMFASLPQAKARALCKELFGAAVPTHA